MGRWFLYMFNHFISLGAINTNIPRAILANYWRRKGVANAINTRTNRLTARTLGAWSLRATLQDEVFGLSVSGRFSVLHTIFFQKINHLLTYFSLFEFQAYNFHDRRLLE